MIINVVEKNKKILGIQKDYEQWKLSKQITNKVIQIGNKYRNYKKKLSKQITEVINIDNRKLSIETHTKDTIQKKLLQNNIYKEIFNYWNSKEIIKHRILDDPTKRKIIAMLKVYTLEEIKKAIHIYSVIIKDEDDEYFFHYRFTLKNFLSRKFEEFKDAKVAHESFLKFEKKDVK